MVRGASVLGFCGVVLATAQPAYAQPPGGSPLDVEFTGPAECGSSERLLEYSRELLGSDASHADVEVTAKVTAPHERRYTLRLELRGAVTGDRTISGTNCDEALRAGAVVIALAINPNALTPPPAAVRPAAHELPSSPPNATEATVDATASQPQPTSAPAKPVAQPGVIVDPPDPLPAEADDLSDPTASMSDALVVGLAGRAASGLAPEVRFGLKALVGVAWHGVVLRAHGYFDPPSNHDDALAGAVRVTSFGGGADVCARLWSWSRLQFASCGGWSLTEVNAKAPNVVSSTARRALVSAGSLSAALSVRLGERVSLFGEGGYAVPTARPRFVVDVEGSGTAAVYRVAPGPLASVGLSFGL